MSIDRWDPFRDMMTIREAMDRWLQQGLSGTGQLLSTLRPDSIPIDVIEHDESYEVRASVPGVKPEDVEVVVQWNRTSGWFPQPPPVITSVALELFGVW